MTSDNMRVFISYSRTDAALCDDLVADLEARGFEPLVDRRSLPYGEEFKAELKSLIEEADATIWLLSQRSIVSDWCKFEIDEISRQSKKLIPILIDSIDDDFIPHQIRALQFLPRFGTFVLNDHLDELIDALLSDRSWLREHSDLSRVANRWEASQRRGLLLSGKALKDAQNWASRRTRTAPPIPAAVEQLIQESRRQQRRRGIAWAAGALTLCVTAVLTGVFVNQQRETAERGRSAALENERIAVKRQTEGLAASAQAALGRGHTSDALRLALAAWPRSSDPHRPALQATVDALRAAMSSPMEARSLKDEDGEVNHILSSDHSRYIITISFTKRIARAWSLGEWRSVSTFRLPNSDGPVADPPCACPTAISVDGSYFAWATIRGEVRVWAVSTGLEVSAPFQHGGSIQGLAFSRDGRRLAVAAQGAMTHIWDITTGKAVVTPLQQSVQVTRLALLEGGRLLTTSSDSSIQLWSIENWGRIWGTRVNALGISDIAVSPDDKKLMIGSATGRSFLIDINSGSELIELNTRQWLYSTKFTSDGKRVATLARDGIVRIWDSESGSMVAETDSQSHQVVSFSLSEDSKLITTAAVDGVVRKWNIETGRAEGDAIRHRSSVVSAITTSVLADTIIVAGDGEVFEWRNEHAPQRYEIPLHDPASISQAERIFLQFRPRDGAPAIGLTASPDGTLAAVSSADRVSIFEIATGIHIGSNSTRGGSRSLEFSPDGRWLAASFADGCVGLFRVQRAEGLADPVINCRRRGDIEIVRFVPDGRHFVTAASDGSVEIWTASGENLIGTERVHIGPLRGLAIDVNGGLLATVDGRGALRIWSLPDGRLTHDLGEIDGGVVAVAFEAASNRLYYVSASGSVRPVEISAPASNDKNITGSSIRVSAKFSPSGDVAIIQMLDGFVLHETRTSRVLGRVPLFTIDSGRRSGIVTAIWVAHKSNLVVTKTIDHDFQLWTLSGIPISRPIKGASMFAMPVISSDGSNLIVAGTTLRVFAVSHYASGDWFNIACDRLGGSTSLSETERRYGFSGLMPICGSNRAAFLDWTALQ